MRIYIPHMKEMQYAKFVKITKKISKYKLNLFL